MSAQFKIDVLPGGLLRYRLSGFFSRDDLRRFSAEVDRAFSQVDCGTNAHVSLLNVSDCALQSQDTVAAFQAMLARPDRRARRTAFVLESSLARMQVRRLISGRADAAMFDDEATAMAWLRSTERRAA